MQACTLMSNGVLTAEASLPLGSILRFLASASALSKIAERLFNIWRKSGTEASYIERDIDEDPFCWKEKDDYPRRRACAQQAFSMHLVWRKR